MRKHSQSLSHHPRQRQWQRNEKSQRPLLHARADGPQVGVHLARWRAEDERDDGVARNLDVLECAQDVYLAVDTVRSAPGARRNE